MFKSLKRSGEKVKERVDFKLSFHASRIPLAGWDKLVVSVIPLETRRVSYKTNRAACKNGSCHWTDNVIETTKLLKDTKTHEYEEKPYKFIVSTGSSRSGVLGEAVVNVAEYTQSNNPSQISLTLKNCNYGSILHVTITCLTPRLDGGLERARAPEVNELVIEDGEDVSGSDEDDMEDSDQSGNITTGSATSNNSAPTSKQRSSFSKDKSGARLSIDPLEPSTPKQNGNGRAFSSDNVSSPTSSLNSSGRHDKERDRAAGRTLTSQDSNNSSTSLPPAYGRGSSHANGTASGTTVPHSTRSNNDRDWATQRSFGSRAASENGSRAGSQRDLGGREALQADLAAAETTIEELRTETVSAQILNRKLTMEVENMKQLLNTHKRHGAESDMEMTTLIAERDRLKMELEQKRSSKMAFEERETGEGNARWKVEDAQQTIRELTDEVRYQKDLNVSLSAQVRKTQDSNLELVLAIKDVEEALEETRLELETLKTAKHKLEEDLQQEQEWKVKFHSLQEKNAGNTPPSSKDGYEVRIKGLEKMVERLTQDVEDLELEVKELTNENMELRENLISSTRMVPDTQLKDSSPAADTTSLELLVVELKSKLAASEDNQRSMLARNEAYVVDTERSLAELLLTNEILQQHLKESRDEAEQARRQAEDANLRSVSLQSSGDMASRSNAELERSLADVRAALASREQELVLLEESSSRAEEERSTALEKAAGLEDEMMRLEGEIRTIIDGKALAEDRCSILQREKEELVHSLEEARNKVEETKDVFGRSASQLSKIRSLEEDIIELDRKKLELEKTVREVFENELLSKSRIQDLELEVSAGKEEISALNLVIHNFDERFLKLERELFNADTEKSDLRKLIEAGEDREKLLKDQVSTLQEEVSLTKGRLEALSASRRSQDSPTARNDGNPSYFQRSLSRSNSMLNSSPSREAKELHELRGKVAVLEGLIKKKTMDLDAAKRDYSSKESDLYNKIELLQMANDQLIQGGPDLGMDQLQMELQRLQNQNSILARRERELVSQLSTQEVLHKEVQRLQEENEQLETRFNRFKETAKFGNLMDKVIALDNELSEQIETNAMYKEQLRSAFEKQQNVESAALNNYGGVDEIITNLVRYKGYSSKLEGDVKDLRERYATMSLRYAEVEAQREELVMTVRNLRNGKNGKKV
ncbi:hypothetical protein MPTK1_4g12160 [Marchantia polymorpha subsp. ruderalis]|uniref:C2 NT-type domain-containing protein n=2 Tax=Marchantia polymorpha TaxID=3197 RepID=A0A176VNA7_MARPO|nr:hypothetical protein AXG93_1175s1170 [Marchantia polymorpha subsp. ruderalis]PTQ46544.1 hypothetical protein MARPO_0011s0198 [Marchantia polymorpha]BBN08509.1 hypothetical protein Mp_4g12160 [Marchantia polymorpha subsp. ruderalis]|eukprot:PTQ46544.1 hypothetical protein MARPO_0011s0198 [Marchantia polymorpha]